MSSKKESMPPIMWDMVLPDMQERARLLVNTLDAMGGAYQEALDLIVHLRQYKSIIQKITKICHQCARHDEGNRECSVDCMTLKGCTIEMKNFVKKEVVKITDVNWSTGVCTITRQKKA